MNPSTNILSRIYSEYHSLHESHAILESIRKKLPNSILCIRGDSSALPQCSDRLLNRCHSTHPHKHFNGLSNSLLLSLHSLLLSLSFLFATCQSSSFCTSPLRQLLSDQIYLPNDSVHCLIEYNNSINLSLS